jgi:tetratricopeptide (TPR) repeat protein
MNRPLRRSIALFVLAASLASTVNASAAGHTWSSPASEPSAAAVQEGKALYVAGNRAVEQGRWSDALTDFEKAYALTGVPAALFNVATSLRALGRHVEARDAFTQLLDKHPKLDPDVRAQAEKMLSEEKARIAKLIVADLPSKKDDLKLYVDGSETADLGDRPLAIELDPGKHALRVEEAKSKPFTWEGTFKDGEKQKVPVKLVPADVAKPPPPPPPAQPEKSGSIFSSGWFWLATGVVVAGAATGAYFYDRSKQLEPESGTVVRP